MEKQPSNQTEGASLVNVAAEQHVLGTLLLHEQAFAVMGSRARDDLFGDPVHRAIFGEIRRRRRAEEYVSPVSLRLWAEGHEGLRELGGARYLVHLSQFCSDTTFPHLLPILDELRAKRELANAMERAQEKLADEDTTATEIAGELENALCAGVADVDRGPTSLMAASTRALERIRDAQNGVAPPGVTTGLRALDDLVPRFAPGHLIVLGGRPSMGKSALAIEVAVNVARAGSPVCFCSLEMPEDEIAMRVLSSQMSVDGNAVEYARLDSGELSDSQYRQSAASANAVADLPLFFLDETYREIGALFAGAKQVHARQGQLGLVVVDYLQLLRSSGKSRYEQITEISIGLKMLARQLNAPVLALAQLSRQVEQRAPQDRRPQLSDLRESGQIEQDADKVLFCYRDEYYLERAEPDPSEADAHDAWQRAMERARGKMEVIVAKQRQGRIGTATVNFAPAMNRFWEWGI